MRRKKVKSDNPEVQAAIETRDKLIGDMQEAVQNVDKLLIEYAEAEGIRRDGIH